MILFFHLLFGLWFAWRVYLSTERSFFAPFVIKSCIFAYLILLALLSQADTLWFIIGIHLPIFLFIFSEWLWIHKKRAAFQDQFLFLLDTAAARLKMGHGWRESLDLSISALDPSPIRDDFNELKDRVIFSQNLNPTAGAGLRFAFQTFKQADLDSQPGEKLDYIRKALKVEAHFQKKSRQTLLQIHLQSFILIFLYISLFIFCILFYSAKAQGLMFFSAFLFALGALATFTIGRKIKWTL